MNKRKGHDPTKDFTLEHHSHNADSAHAGYAEFANLLIPLGKKAFSA